MNNRTDWVDYAKAIGIILVVYGHVARGVFNAGIAIPKSVYLLADSIIYSFHMPLFFFLSGLFFCQSLQKKGGKALVFSKIDTVVYPYILWSLIQGSIEIALSNFTNGNVSFAEVASLLWEPRAQFWFLYALFFVFVTATLVYSTKANKYSTAILAVSAILYVYPELLPSFNVFIFLSQNLVFFCFGIVFMTYDKIKYLADYKLLLFMTLAFVLGQWLFHGYFELKYYNKGAGSLLLALISIIFITSVSGRLARKSFKFLTFIGTSSMAIYVMHILAGSGARVILNKVFNVNDYSVHLIVGCIIGIAAPLIAVKIVNYCKIPFVFSAPISRLLMRSPKA